MSSVSVLASEDECRKAIQDVSINSGILREYELKKSVSREMEENRVRIVDSLKESIPVQIELAIHACRE